ncbi:hypothetical protein PG985_013971 [Apiospora marii]|uniref:2EXR domain-containing protein n=1 Tax=Apiospora marii TaxID=335849 RepID=A0ABR1R6E1_9PEZI
MPSKLRPYRPPVYTHNKEYRNRRNSPSADLSPQFPLFARLPSELQLQIWEHAAAAPQILLIDKDYVLHSESGLLAACTASRTAFLQFPEPVRTRHGLSSAPKDNEEPLGRRLECRLGLDLLVLDEEAGAWLRDWTALRRIPRAREIRHLAVPYHAAFGAAFMPDHRTGEATNGISDFDWRMAKYFPSLRTWEVYADWIDSLDQQAADGRQMRDKDVVWLPPYRGLRITVATQVLQNVDPIKGSLYEHREHSAPCTRERPCTWHDPRALEKKKKLVGRPIFDLDRSGLGLDP